MKYLKVSLVMFLLLLIYTFSPSETSLSNIQSIRPQLYHPFSELSIDDMKTLIGGNCGGSDGTSCGDSNHTCDSDCIHLSATVCVGTGTGCSNDYWVYACDCETIYWYVSGCM